MTDGDAVAGPGIVHPEAVEVDAALPDSRASVELLVDLVAATGRVTDPGAALEAVLEREAAAPTGVGGGVAVPHARTDAVDGPTLSFVRLRNGVDFGGPGDADLVFLLLVPEDGDADHLATLSRLSGSLLESTLAERLRSADSRAAVVSILREVVE